MPMILKNHPHKPWYVNTPSNEVVCEEDGSIVVHSRVGKVVPESSDGMMVASRFVHHVFTFDDDTRTWAIERVRGRADLAPLHVSLKP